MPAVTPPEQFGRYRILNQLGRGGMGAVFLADDTQLGRQVALKVPHIDPDDGPVVLQRFYREARAAATLNHPNICPVYDVGTLDGIPYMTMAYIEGQTLAAAIKSGMLFPQSAAARIVHTLAMALTDAHRRGVIHRDLKPANVIMNERGEPVVMDFGLARLAGANAARLTGSGAMLGTPAYMPPEQVNGDMEAIGPPSDIYSLGVVLYELLTGHLPFEGSVGAVLGQILTQAPKRPSTYRLGLDPRLEAICLKAMQKEIAARHASMDEFARALGEYLQPATPPIAVAVPARPTAPVRPPRWQELGDTRIEAAADREAKTERGRATQPRRASHQATLPVRRERRLPGVGVGLGCGIGMVAGGLAVMAAAVVALLLWTARPPADALNEKSKQALDAKGPDKDSHDNKDLAVNKEEGGPLKDLKSAGSGLDTSPKDNQVPADAAPK